MRTVLKMLRRSHARKAASVSVGRIDVRDRAAMSEFLLAIDSGDADRLS